MADQRLQKRPCVMIVDHDMEFGIKLADWLATNGYQVVFVRSMETAIDECPDLQPQAIFIALGYAESMAARNLRKLFHTIATACPGVSTITMGERASEALGDITSGGAHRHVHLPLKSIEFTYIGRLLRSELNAAMALPNQRRREFGARDGWAVENPSCTRALNSEAARWIP